MMRQIACALAAAAVLAPVGAGQTPGPAPVYGYTVVAVHPHDPASFTEGLEYHDGYLLESSGPLGAGYSSLRRVALASGRVLQLIRVRSPYFAEGATILGDRVYQLTWQQKTGFVYDLRTLRRLRTFHYDGEGWGLTNSGTQLIMSDGTDKLRFRDPGSFAVLRTLSVRDGGQPVAGLNELEVVNGVIFANVYTTDRIACIDAKTGQVRYWLDLTGLLPPELRSDESAVLNGIAYDPKQHALIVTGKLWPRLFEIRRGTLH
jgi:glutamine cyclotransferase